MRLLKYAKKSTSEKKVALSDVKEDVDKISIEVQKNLWQRRWKAYTGFSLQHKTLSALNCAQYCGLHSRKVSVMSCLCQHSQLCLSHRRLTVTNWIPKIMVQFCYSRLYFGIDNVSRRLLQWIARIKNELKRRPTTRYRTYSNQIMKVLKKVTFEAVYGRTCMTMSGRSVREHVLCVWIFFGY